MEQSNLEIICTQLEDYENLSEYLSKEFSEGDITSETWKSRFLYWWDKNPNFSSECDCRGWLIKNNGLIVGTINIIPTTISFRDIEYKVYNLSSWYVSPSFRSKSIELFFKARNIGKQTIIFNTTPTKEMFDFMKKFKFQEYEMQEIVNTAMFPINFTKLLNYKFSNPFFRFFHKINFIINPLLRFFFKLNLSNTYTEIYSYKIGLFDKNEINSFFRKNIRSDLITNVRNFKNLEWLCESVNKLRKIAIFILDKNSKIKGYALFKIINKGIVVFELIDSYFDKQIDLNEKKKIISSLINACKYFSEKEKSIDLISFPAFGGIPINLLYNKGLLKQKRGVKNKLFFTQNKIFLDAIKKGNFYFTNQGDMNLL